jgi:hypothetical protein
MDRMKELFNGCLNVKSIYLFEQVSEGPEVRRTADKIAEAGFGRSIIDLQCEFMKNDMREK